MRRLTCWIRGHRREMKAVAIAGGGARVVSYCGRCDQVFWGIE